MRNDNYLERAKDRLDDLYVLLFNTCEHAKEGNEALCSQCISQALTWSEEVKSLIEDAEGVINDHCLALGRLS
jgi:hypothetical protein